MNRKAELSINLIVIIVIALLILIVIVFIFGGRSSDFGSATQCIAAGGQCIPNTQLCDTEEIYGDNFRSLCSSGQTCCRIR